jgi:quercetin dioxygenase-like cupin family protein
MKTMSVLLAFLALFFCDLVLAGAAVATAVSGSVQAQAGAAPARVVRQGDEVNQGDTIITGPASSVVLKFDDGQVAALTQNSRMAITAYQYNPATESGNVLLSLVTGGMRAITGLIGKRTPDRVSFRAATATIGIRGSDGNMATANGEVILSVNDGSFTFTLNGQTVVIPAGQAIHAKPDGTFSRGTIAQIRRDLAASLIGQTILTALGGLDNLTALINQAAPGTPRQGDQGQQGQQGQGQQGQPGGQQGGPQGGGGGGGGASGG